MTYSKSISLILILGWAIGACFFSAAGVSNASAAEVRLGWNANTEKNLAGYKIHYGMASGIYSVHIDVQNVTTYTLTGLTAGQTYYFATSAYDISGKESGYSSEVSYTVPAPNAAPSAPATPTGSSSAMVDTLVTFSTSATDVNGDSLQYRYDWGDGVISDWGAASQSHSWSAAGQYAVRAQARDRLGLESAWSSGFTVTIAPPPPPLKDSDGDGVPDIHDAFPNDPKEWADVNGNGIGDNADALAAQAPAAPVLVSPIKDEAVSAIALLKTGAFQSSVAGVIHAKTRWQVFRDEDAAWILDIQSTTALTSFTIPKLALDEGTAYFWRAQFIDSKGRASAWSDYEHFATVTTGADVNANGIRDALEVADTVDLDRDGVKDNQQTTIKSAKMEGANVQIGVSIKNCTTALAVEAVESQDPRNPDVYASGKPKQMPFGIITFKIAVGKPGDQAVVQLYFSEAAKSKDKWYNYDFNTGKWFDFSSRAGFASDRHSVALTLSDGGPEDADGVANGLIIAMGGIEASDEQGGNNTQTASSSNSSTASCFIGTSADSEENPILLICLTLIGISSLQRLSCLRKRKPE